MRVRDALMLLLRAPLDAGLKILVDRKERDGADPLVFDPTQITPSRDGLGPWVVSVSSTVDEAPVYSEVWPSFRFKCGLCGWKGTTGEENSEWFEGGACPSCGELESITDYGAEGVGSSIPEPPKNCVRMRIAVAVWQDSNGVWRGYGEGASYGEKVSPKAEAEETLANSGANDGEPLHWRWVEAWVPVPADHEYEVEGRVTDG